jgi:hypothetical protein
MTGRKMSPGNQNPFILALYLKAFNSVVLDDPRKTVYKKVNRGSRETDPSQVYFV